MNKYELIMIFDPAQGEDKIAQFAAKVEEKIKGLGGEIEKTEKWGSRRLNSMIKKAPRLTQGYYILTLFQSPPNAPDEVRAFLKVSENVIRYFISKAVPRVEPRVRGDKPAEAVEIGEIKGEPLGESK